MLLEIWSDVACPWCAIGRARLGRALAQVPYADEIEVVWRSFELDPTAPRQLEGSYVDRLARKYRVSSHDAQAMIDRMTATAAAEGLDFRFDVIRPGNTFDAHRLIHLGARCGLQSEVKARFLRGYLEEGWAIGRPEALHELAVDAGLAADDVADVLATDRFAGDVRADEAAAREFGISGVPFFVLDRRVGLSGAQEPAMLVKVLEHARSQAHADADAHDETHAHGEACVDGSCAV